MKLSLIDNLEKFQAADFEVKEKNGVHEISNILTWNKIVNNPHTNCSSNNDDLKENKKKSKKNNSNNNENNKTPNTKNQNIILKNKIICLIENCIYLRSLCVECEIHLLMSGESNFYIFSRCQEKFSESTVVCCISKELESSRKFITFAVLEQKEENEFYIKNIKKQEIPHQESYIKSIDISEIKFIFIDNGDDRCFVFLDEQEQNSNLLLVGDFYIPIEEKSNLMIAADGDLISVKKMVIKQSSRNSYINYKNNNNFSDDSVQSCSCCNII